VGRRAVPAGNRPAAQLLSRGESRHSDRRTGARAARAIAVPAGRGTIEPRLLAEELADPRPALAIAGADVCAERCPRRSATRVRAHGRRRGAGAAGTIRSGRRGLRPRVIARPVERRAAVAAPRTRPPPPSSPPPP